jgi:hypothetical protein
MVDPSAVDADPLEAGGSLLFGLGQDDKTIYTVGEVRKDVRDTIFNRTDVVMDLLTSGSLKPRTILMVGQHLGGTEFFQEILRTPIAKPLLDDATGKSTVSLPGED